MNRKLCFSTIFGLYFVFNCFLAYLIRDAQGIILFIVLIIHIIGAIISLYFLIQALKE